MKKIVKIIIVLLISLTINVYAENYSIKELIPYNIKTSIHTNNFSYKGIKFDKEKISFDGIKNLTDKEIPISISIGLFNSRGRNIGVINYCDLTIKSKEEISFNIKYDKKYLGKNSSVKDIKYIAVLGDNITCKTKGSRNFIGQNVDKMGILHKEKFDDQTEFLFSILTILGGAFIVLIIYKLLFTNKYKNINGNIVRKSYDEINKELKEKREENLKNNPPVVEEKVSNKPVEILEQEEKAKNEDKDSTDLHNLYK